MSEKGLNKVAELSINGHRLAVRSEDGEEHIRSVESYLNTKIEEAKENTKAVSTLDLALLAALNITGEIIKVRETLDKMGRKSEELTKLIDRRLD